MSDQNPGAPVAPPYAPNSGPHPQAPTAPPAPPAPPDARDYAARLAALQQPQAQHAPYGYQQPAPYVPQPAGAVYPGVPAQPMQYPATQNYGGHNVPPQSDHNFIAAVAVAVAQAQAMAQAMQQAPTMNPANPMQQRIPPQLPPQSAYPNSDKGAPAPGSVLDFEREVMDNPIGASKAAIDAFISKYGEEGRQRWMTAATKRAGEIKVLKPA